ncbi:MAG: CoA transferase [bacterium]
MLTGVKVLDLSRVLAGPMCAMQLGDLGADVLKVERPDGGDETRGWGPPFDQRGESAYYLSVNRNKLGITIDLDTAADVDTLRDLIGQADVVLENFRPGALARRGVGASAMRSAHPTLIWCAIGGFANEPTRPGYDFVVQAESGWMSVTGEPDGAPMKHGVALADVIAGKDATIAILGALVSRGRTGAGTTIDISLSASAEAALVNVAQNALVSENAPRRWGNAHANLVPYELFKAADRGIVIAVGSDAQWLACVRALGLERLAEDGSLLTNAGRLAARERVVVAIRDQVRQRSAAEWRARLDAAGVPCGMVRTVPEMLAERDASPQTGMPLSIPGLIRRRPPTLGEHNAVVRAKGWSAFSEVGGLETRS